MRSSSANESDGFNIQFPYLPAGLDDFVEQVVPELQRRGIFRREYEGKTLRENLGLTRPPDPFAQKRELQSKLGGGWLALGETVSEHP